MKYLRLFADTGLLIRLNTTVLPPEGRKARRIFHTERATGFMSEADRNTIRQIIATGRVPIFGKLLSTGFTYIWVFMLLDIAAIIFVPNDSTAQTICRYVFFLPMILLMVLSASLSGANPLEPDELTKDEGSS
ncbi:MAG: hypothetical protein JNK63_01480 [Chthonomonas sp.]|nr:hypothetical protein [Chthonomonas sp.]